MSALPVDILLVAFTAGMLVLATHVPLGRQVINRGIIFIDLAIAQAAATGFLLADTVFHAGPVSAQLIAVLTALVAAGLLFWIERILRTHQEAMIGGLFVVLASSAMLLTAAQPQAGEHLQSVLAGQILWSDHHTLASLALSAAVALIMMAYFRHPLVGFYLPFAIAITASVQAVGVYLVFASLIFPALASHSLGTPVRQVIAGGLIGLAGYFIGLLLSLMLDLPSGPAIVCSLAAIALLSGLVLYHRHPRQRPDHWHANG